MQNSAILRSNVLRNHQETNIISSSLVPGDVITLRAGDLVPADARILWSENLCVDQSIISGENITSLKQCVLEGEKTSINEASCVLLMGSSILSGVARALICRTGSRTVLGSISKTLKKEKTPSPLFADMNKLGSFVMFMAIFLIISTFLVNLYFKDVWIDSLMFAIAVGISMTPEFLPMIMTIALSKSAKNLAKSNIVIKNITSLYDLGRMDILCSDKTGTLTQGHFVLEKVIDADENNSTKCFQIAYLSSAFTTGYKSPFEKAVLAHETIDISMWQKLDEVPFSVKHRRVCVLLKGTDENICIAKGPVEDILGLCTQSGTIIQASQKILALSHSFSKEGLRVLGVAYKNVPAHMIKITDEQESNFGFCGLLVFSDTPKHGAKETILKLKQYDISIKILTGDNEMVTKHLCDTLTIDIEGILTGPEIAIMTDHDLMTKLSEVNLFCHLVPHQKERIVRLFKKAKNVVGFLGDGINDLSALHCADVSISVNNAVDFVKSEASFVLMKKDLDIIYQGVLEGRKTFANLLKYILLELSANFGNMISMLFASVWIPFLPMLPVHLLLSNLLYDLVIIVLPCDVVDNDALLKPPKWDFSFIYHFMIIFGLISSLFDLCVFYLLFCIWHFPQKLFQTGWFLESLFTEILVIFIVRTKGLFWKSPPSKILCYISSLSLLIGLTLSYCSFFDLACLPIETLVILLCIVFGYLVTTEVAKHLIFKRA